MENCPTKHCPHTPGLIHDFICITLRGTEMEKPDTAMQKIYFGTNISHTKERRH